MPSFSLTVPANRQPLHVSRRDLALDCNEDVRLDFTVVNNDAADATPIALSDASGDGITVNVWYRSWAWDYGMAVPAYAGYGSGLLWSGAGTIVDGPSGRVDVVIPAGTVSTWRGRLDWTAQLTYGSALFTVMRGAVSVHV